MNIIKIIILFFVLIVFIVFSSVIIYKNKINSYTSDKKYSVLMAGRSTTNLFFRYWNYPQFLNDLSVWKNWHLPYKKYVYNNIYFEYFETDDPQKKSSLRNQKFGDLMYENLSRKLDKSRFDALFVEFCFIDFEGREINNDNAVQKRSKNLIQLAKRFYSLTKNKNMMLILGTALPVLNPSPYSQKVRLAYNRWVRQYATENDNIMLIDFYKHLVDKNGFLKSEYSIAPEANDSHINILGFNKFKNEFYKIKE